MSPLSADRGPVSAVSVADAPPEFAALVAALRVDEGPGVRALRRGALAHPQLDPGRLLALAERHRVFSLLFAAIARDAPDLVPEPVLSRLRALAHANALRARFVAEETARLITLGADANIGLIAYKGSILAARIYPDPDLRAVGDIDLLVPRRDRLRADQLLRADGYALESEPEVREHWHLEPRRHIEKMYSKETPHLCLSLDIHWGLFREYWPFALTADDLLLRARPFDFEGRSLRVVDFEDLLLVLAAHGTKHLWARLAWLVDIDRLVRAVPALDWTALAARARQLGVLRLLSVTLHLSERLLDTPISDDLRAAFTFPPGETAIINRLVRERLHELATACREDDVVLFHPFHHHVRERWRDRFAYLRYWYLTRYLSLTWVRNSLRPNEFDRAYVRLPPALSVLYVVVRPVRLVHRALGRLVGRRGASPHRTRIA